MIGKNLDLKSKNLYSFKGPGKSSSDQAPDDSSLTDAPHEADDQVTTGDEKPISGTLKEILIQTVGTPHSCESAKDPQCQVSQILPNLT